MQPPHEHLPVEDMIAELQKGSSIALVKATRMVTRLLVEYRAYDFADRWEGLVEGVLGELLRLQPVVGRDFDARLRRTTLDDLSFCLRAKTEWHEDGELPWCESSRMGDWPTADRGKDVAQFKMEITCLPEQRSVVVRDVYGDGRSFDQVASERKLPLRMVKRYLRESIWDLRERSGHSGQQQRVISDLRVKSCLKSLELDLPAFLVEPHLDTWRDFRAHYPMCLDCATVVSNWSGVESLIREACGGIQSHPCAEDLIALHRDGEGLGYSQYVSLMRHLDGCPPCGEAMTLLARYDGRPFAQLLIGKAGQGRRAPRHLKAQSFLRALVARIRNRIGV